MSARSRARRQRRQARAYRGWDTWIRDSTFTRRSLIARLWLNVWSLRAARGMPIGGSGMPPF